MKGIAFSIDMMFAIVVAFILLAVAISMSARSQDDSVPPAYLSRIADDALASMHRNGTLATLDSAFTNSVLNASLPDSIGYRLTVDVFSCNSDCTTITKQGNSYSVVSGLPETPGTVVVRRTFLTFGSGNVIQYFNNAELKVWLI